MPLTAGKMILGSCDLLSGSPTVNPRPPNKKAVPWDGLFLFGAGERVRTVDLNLGKVALYQLSYARIL